MQDFFEKYFPYFAKFRCISRKEKKVRWGERNGKDKKFQKEVLL